MILLSFLLEGLTLYMLGVGGACGSWEYRCGIGFMYLMSMTMSEGGRGRLEFIIPLMRHCSGDVIT